MKHNNPDHRHLSSFWKLRCAPDLLRLNIFPNVKEYTESAAAFDAFARFIPWLQSEKVTLIAVGDGSTPRTAALFAFRTAWECHSVDPAIRNCGRWAQVERLSTYKCRIEDVKFTGCKKALVVAVHSHADLRRAVESVGAEQLAVIAVECCVPQRLDTPPDHEYRDAGIWSPCNRVKVWLPKVNRERH